MTTINVPGQIRNEELILCGSIKGLMNCREFFILLERFCINIGKKSPKYDEFLNLYFNDEGYVDIWRIPHLMIDVFNQNLKFYTVLECEEFRTTFHQFLTELYNYCLSECQTGLYVKPDSISTQSTLNNLRIRQQFLNTLMETFISVIENIENYDKAEIKA